jgi:hypothetical protein
VKPSDVVVFDADSLEHPRRKLLFHRVGFREESTDRDTGYVRLTLRDAQKIAEPCPLCFPEGVS